MVYSVLFNTVIEALNLILEKYVAEIQLPGNIIQLLSIPQSSGMACHWRFPSHHMNLKCCCSLQKLAAEHFLKPSPFKLPSHAPSHLSSNNLGKMAISVML